MAEVSQTPAINRTIPLGQYAGEEKNPVQENTSGSTPERATPAKDSSATNEQQDKVTLSREARLIMSLKASDRKVPNHEAAHAAVGGQYAGSPSYTYRLGPDGNRYAVAGEVPIDVSEIPGDPVATLNKAQIVRAAALAPLDPSAQDQKVAAVATQMAVRAQTEILTAETEEGTESGEDDNATTAEEESPDANADFSSTATVHSLSWYA
jgi:hypothetical protein